jgi:hypothetical protein
MFAAATPSKFQNVTRVLKEARGGCEDVLRCLEHLGVVDVCVEDMPLAAVASDPAARCAPGDACTGGHLGGDFPIEENMVSRTGTVLP